MPIYGDINQYQFGPQIKPMLHDVEAVYQSINNILTTNIGERLMNPEFGSNLQNLLMEPIDKLTTSQIYVSVVHAIKRWDQRIILIQAKSHVKAISEEDRYEIVLVFRIKGVDNQVFNYVGSAVKSSKKVF